MRHRPLALALLLAVLPLHAEQTDTAADAARAYFAAMLAGDSANAIARTHFPPDLSPAQKAAAAACLAELAQQLDGVDIEVTPDILHISDSEAIVIILTRSGGKRHESVVNLYLTAQGWQVEIAPECAEK